MMQPDIDFDQALAIGRKAYNKRVGQWWRQQSCDAPHAYAYKNIANEMASLNQRKSPVIVDYACGTGSLLARLVKLYPGSELYGIDGSSFMLNSAKKRLRRSGLKLMERVKLLQTNLPDFSLPQGVADVIVYAFPHIVSGMEEQSIYEDRNREDAGVARFLVMEKEESGQDAQTEEDEIAYQSLFMERMVSRNLHGLLKRGGICVRVEYAEAENGEEPTGLDEQLLGFQEASFDQPINGIITDQLFKEVSTTYFRSRVIWDVFHQTGEEVHRTGGYYVTVLKAV